LKTSLLVILATNHLPTDEIRNWLQNLHLLFILQRTDGGSSVG